MSILLRKKDIVSRLGSPKSTVNDWIDDFRVYIPLVKQGAITYYKEEAVQVLSEIKELRAQHLTKDQIFQVLSDKGYAITVEEAVQDMNELLNSANHPLNTIAATLGQTVSKVADLDDQMSEVTENQSKQNGLIERQSELIEELNEALNQMNAKIELMNAEKNMSWIKKIFRKK